MHVRLSKLASPLKPEAIGTFTDGVLDVAHIDCPSARRQLPRPMMSATCLMVNYPVVLGWENADVVPVLRLSTIGSGLPPCSVRAHHGRIRTKSRDRLYGSSVGMAAERAAAARKRPTSLLAMPGTNGCSPSRDRPSHRRRSAMHSMPATATLRSAVWAAILH